MRLYKTDWLTRTDGYTKLMRTRLSVHVVSGLGPPVSKDRSLCPAWVHLFPKSVHCVRPGSTRSHSPLVVSGLGPRGSKVRSLLPTWVHLVPKSVRCVRLGSARFQSPFVASSLGPLGSKVRSRFPAWVHLFSKVPSLFPDCAHQVPKSVGCVRPVSARFQDPFAVSSLGPPGTKVRSLCPVCVHQFPKSVRCV